MKIFHAGPKSVRNIFDRTRPDPKIPVQLTSLQ